MPFSPKINDFEPKSIKKTKTRLMPCTQALASKSTPKRELRERPNSQNQIEIRGQDSSQIQECLVNPKSD